MFKKKEIDMETYRGSYFSLSPIPRPHKFPYQSVRVTSAVTTARSLTGFPPLNTSVRTNAFELVRFCL